MTENVINMDLKKILRLSMLFILASCSPEDTDVVVFKMFNDTEHHVRLLAFNSNTDILIDEITLEPNSVYSTIKSRNNTGNFLDEAFYTNNNVDSLRLIFNSNRVNVFLQTTENNDIFHGDQNREYHITEKDFNKTVDCAENCE